jgi:hypothetical protein
MGRSRTTDERAAACEELMSWCGSARVVTVMPFEEHHQVRVAGGRSTRRRFCPSRSFAHVSRSYPGRVETSGRKRPARIARLRIITTTGSDGRNVAIGFRLRRSVHAVLERSPFINRQ